MKNKLNAEEARANVRKSGEGFDVNSILSEIKKQSQAGELKIEFAKELSEEEVKELRDLGYRVTQEQPGRDVKTTVVSWEA
jgi:predicted outer membrane protein